MWLCSVRWAMKYWLSFDFAVPVVPLSSSALLVGRTGCSCVLWARSYVAASWLLVGWLSDLLQEWQNRLCAKIKGSFRTAAYPQHVQNLIQTSFRAVCCCFWWSAVSFNYLPPVSLRALLFLQGPVAAAAGWHRSQALLVANQKKQGMGPQSVAPFSLPPPLPFFPLFLLFFSFFFPPHSCTMTVMSPKWWLRRFHLNFAYGAAQQSSRWSLSFFLSGYSPSMRNLACNSKKVELLSHSLY